jgi:hypothetical protein
MATIIAGEFATMAETESAAAALKEDGSFSADRVTVFMLNAPGQHALHPLGGDRDADSASTHAQGGTVTGAVIGATVGLGAGAAAMAAVDVGPVVAATAAAVGAYTGSLIGTLNKVGDKESPAEITENSRRAGAMVAVNALDAAEQDSAVEILRAHGARQIERAEGRWENGAWVDFDPSATPQLISARPPASVDRPSPKP